MDPTNIRTMIRQKLDSGALPHDHIPRFWGGPADGGDCDVCEEVIRADQLLMEAISTTTNQGLQFHVECFYLWDTERDAPGRK
jgi:hypothetical protein